MAGPVPENKGSPLEYSRTVFVFRHTRRHTRSSRTVAAFDPVSSEAGLLGWHRLLTRAPSGARFARCDVAFK
jgi:hypothetical protein